MTLYGFDGVWRRISSLIRLISVAAALAGANAAIAAPIQDHLTLIVPAAVGGGWDITAKAMKTTLEQEHIVDHVDIVRYPGAGGLIGLTEFATRYRGREDALLIGGLVMLGSSLREEAAVTLRDVIPIARLTGEWSMVVAPTHSPIQTVDDMRNAMLARPDAIRWAGGAYAGPDQSVLWQIAQKLGLPLDEVAYYGRPGGKRVAESLIAKRADIGISGYAEFSPYVSSGELRIIATAAPQRIAGVNAPTLREAGLDVTMMNWRAVFAAPGVDAAAQDRLAAIIKAMVRSPTWSALLTKNHWTDTYLEGDIFTQFIDREQTRWASMVNPMTRASDATLRPKLPNDWRSLELLGAILIVLAGLLAFLLMKLRARRAAATDLEQRYGGLVKEMQERAEGAGKIVRDGIDGDFGDWKLSSAECDVAWFMLRGLPLREIAELRGTSERTVRQQAQAIYRKAGLEGRSDLAGRVLERFI